MTRVRNINTNDRLHVVVNHMLTAKMIALVLLGFLACSSAAPRFHHHEASPSFHDDPHHRFFEDDIFDTRSFWDQLRRDLLSLDSVVEDFVKHFPSSVSSETIEGDLYKIRIPLPGFEEKDIVVKAKKGLVMIQAVHRYESTMEKTYIDMRSLPASVDENGKWTYKDDILSIEFPLSGKEGKPKPDATTASPSFHSREEMEPDNTDTNQNADTGADRGDVVESGPLVNVPGGNNAIEATTYAVDLKDEVEFVPVRQVK